MKSKRKRATPNRPALCPPDHSNLYYLLAEARAKYKPATAFEDQLVDQIAYSHFRANRFLDALSLLNVTAAGPFDETIPRAAITPPVLNLLRRSARSAELCIQTTASVLAHCQAHRARNEPTPPELWPAPPNTRP